MLANIYPGILGGWQNKWIILLLLVLYTLVFLFCKQDICRKQGFALHFLLIGCLLIPQNLKDKHTLPALKGLVVKWGGERSMLEPPVVCATPKTMSLHSFSLAMDPTTEDLFQPIAYTFLYILTYSSITHPRRCVDTTVCISHGARHHRSNA